MLICDLRQGFEPLAPPLSGCYRRAMRVVAAGDAVDRIREGGGQLFVWPIRSRSFRLTLTDLPRRALDFQRFDAGEFLLFLHPAIRTLPDELVVTVRGRLRPHIEVYWEGLGYV